MISTTYYCGGPDEVCVRCGQPLLGPNQICRAMPDAMDEVSAYITYIGVEEDDEEPLTRRDWRLLLQQVQRGCVYYAQRATRPNSRPGGADERTLDRLRRLEPLLARAAGDG